MSIRKSRFTMALMWAMISLTVFGSMPRIGCICANGNHKFFCERHRTQSADARCTCCYGRAAAKGVTAQRTPAASGTMTCCGSKHAAGCAGLGAFDTDCPCRPVLDRPLVVTAARATLDLDQASHTPLFVALELLPTIAPSTAIDFVRGELLPPPDLVITLGVMLI